jgi:hypothetical protein
LINEKEEAYEMKEVGGAGEEGSKWNEECGRRTFKYSLSTPRTSYMHFCKMTFYFLHCDFKGSFLNTSDTYLVWLDQFLDLLYRNISTNHTKQVGNPNLHTRDKKKNSLKPLKRKSTVWMGCVLQNCSRIPSSSQDSQYRPCFD